MKYKVNVTVKGSVSRPSYDGTITITTSDDSFDFADLRDMVYYKLKRTSFPEILKDAVIVHNIVPLYQDIKMTKEIKALENKNITTDDLDKYLTYLENLLDEI